MLGRKLLHVLFLVSYLLKENNILCGHIEHKFLDIEYMEHNLIEFTEALNWT